MNSYSKGVKGKLLSIIDSIESRKEMFVYDPKRDFTRTRKLSFSTMMELILSMGGGCLSNELLDFFNYDVNTVTSSGFVQSRSKIKPEAFYTLLREFTGSFSHYKTFRGYRLIAVDGSDLLTYYDPKNLQTYHRLSEKGKGCNYVHINAMYDLLNKVYIDACVQPKRNRNETGALTSMLERSDLCEKTILIADRGYESYNVLAHLIKKKWKFLIRVKDTDKRSVLSTLDLPDAGEFDQQIERIYTCRQTKQVKQNPGTYRFLSNKTRFDFLDDNNLFYTMAYRVLRVEVDDGLYQCFITNLDADEFPSDKICDLYFMRWGIETSFRDLKHTLGLTHLHTKKVEHTIQEIYSKMVMYNFCSIITSHVIIEQKQRKHSYQVNFANAMRICCHFFKSRTNVTPPNVEALIKKFILPIRKGRSNPRKTNSRTFVSFNYRIA